MVKHITPFIAISICVIVGIAAIALAVHYASDSGSVAIAGVGALGQVVVAVLLYFLTREQLQHAKAEAEYRKVEQRIAKQERHLNDMVRVQVAYSNAKTGIGKTNCDLEQVERLHGLKNDMKQYFEQPVSSDFNKMCARAKSAATLAIGNEIYMKEISSYDELDRAIYTDTRKQIDAKRFELGATQEKLEAL